MNKYLLTRTVTKNHQESITIFAECEEDALQKSLHTTWDIDDNSIEGEVNFETIKLCK